MKILNRVGPTMGMTAGLLVCLAIAQLTASPRVAKPRNELHNEPLNDASSGCEYQQNNPFQDLTATMQRLRDEYGRVLAKFTALKLECRSNLKIRVDEAVADAIKWKRAVDSLGLLEKIDLTDLSTTEKELIVRSRFAAQGLTGEALEARVRAFNPNDLGSITDLESQLVKVNRLRHRGLTERQIAEILSGDEALRRELQPMYENLDRLIWESLKNAYNKAYQCCLCSALDFYPSIMAGLFREMTFISETDALQTGSVAKNEECARAVKEKWSGGAGWRGIITYTSEYKYKTSDEKANNVSTFDETSSYEATFQLEGKKDEHGAPIARVRAVASETTVRGGRGTTQCYRISEQRNEVAGSFEDDQATVTVSANQQSGTYFIVYPLPEVKAKGTYQVTGRTGGTCNNPFNKPVDHTEAVTDFPIETGPGVEIKGSFDPNNSQAMVGSASKTIRARHGGEKRLTVSWDLTYCAQ